MKKTTISLMCGAALLCACQSGPEKTTISGTLQDLSNDTLFMMNYPLNQRSEVAVDTILAQEGKFTYEVACDSVPVNLGIYAKPSGAEAEGTGVQKAADDSHRVGVRFRGLWDTAEVQRALAAAP